MRLLTRLRFRIPAVFRTFFVLATIGLSLVVTIGWSLMVTVGLAVIVRLLAPALWTEPRTGTWAGGRATVT
jgi:hypothetical protein